MNLTPLTGKRSGEGGTKFTKYFPYDISMNIKEEVIGLNVNIRHMSGYLFFIKFLLNTQRLFRKIFIFGNGKINTSKNVISCLCRRYKRKIFSDLMLSALGTLLEWTKENNLE